MKKSNIIFLFGSFPLLLASSFIATSIIMILSLWVFFASYILASLLATKLMLEKKSIFAFFFTFSLYCVYVKLGEIFFPIIFLSLLPYLYLLGFSYIVYFSLAEYEETRLPSILLQYSIFFFIISFIREILAFGSLSLPSIYGIANFNIFELIGLSPPFRFLGSFAGTLIMMGVAFTFYFWYANEDDSYLRKDIK